MLLTTLKKGNNMKLAQIIENIEQHVEELESKEKVTVAELHEHTKAVLSHVLKFIKEYELFREING